MRPRLIFYSSLLLAAGYGIGWAQQQKTVIEPVIKTSSTAAGQPVQFPASSEITAVTADVPAGLSNAGFHKHPYQRLVYVLDGTLSVEREGGGIQSYPAGSLLVEMRDIWHRPVTKDQHAKVLVIDFAPKGESNQIARPQ
jgi:quercetin dioxygenase-like cupin family protein